MEKGTFRMCLYFMIKKYVPRIIIDRYIVINTFNNNTYDINEDVFDILNLDLDNSTQLSIFMDKYDLDYNEIILMKKEVLEYLDAA